MNRLRIRLAAASFACLVALGTAAGALAQNPGGDGTRTRGKLTAINGSTLELSRRDGGTQTVLTSEATTFTHNGQPATLADFALNDAVMAHGTTDPGGAFVATEVRGHTRRPHPGTTRAGGVIASIDTTAGSITVTGRDGATSVIYTTADTEFLRNRQPATLADFVAGDHVRARGEVDPNGDFIAERVLGGSRPAPQD